MDQLDAYIEQLKKKIEYEKKFIEACLGSPFYIRENYERALKLNGLDEALTLAMGVAIDSRAA